MIVALGSAFGPTAWGPGGSVVPTARTVAESGSTPTRPSSVGPSANLVQASYPTFANYAGYEGNAVIYPTIFTNNTLLPGEDSSGSSVQVPASACGTVQCGYNSTWASDALTVNTSSSGGVSYYVDSGAPDYQFTLYIFVATTGASQYYTTDCETQNFSCNYNEELSAWTPYQELQESLSGLPTGFNTNILDADMTLNMSSGSVSGTNGGTGSYVGDLVDIGLQTLGLFVPVIGDALTLAAILGDLYALVNSNMGYSGNGFVTSAGPVSGSGSVTEWGQTESGNELNASGGCNGVSSWNYPHPNPCAPTATDTAKQLGWNTFGQGIETETYTGAQSESSAISTLGSVASGELDLYAQNDVEVYDDSSAYQFYGNEYDTAANASIYYLFAPAVALRGTVVDSASGTHTGVAGATVTIQQSCATKHGSVIDDYTETTGAQGQWNFFGNPSCSFSVSATDPQTFGTVGSPTESLGAGTAAAGSMFTFNALPLNNFQLTVENTGGGTPSWSVSIYGTSTGASTSPATKSNQIEFTVPNGTYTIDPSPPAGWWYTPDPMSATVSGATLVKVELYVGYNVKFAETGLTPGAEWTVSFAGYTGVSYSATVPFQLIANGTYSWSVPIVSGYTVSPSSGSLTVAGGAASQTVTFTPTSTYTVTFSESGLGSTYSWEAYIGSTGKTAAAGSTITFTGIAGSNSWTVEEVIVSETCSGDHWFLKYYVPSPASGTENGATHISTTYTLTSKVIQGSCSLTMGQVLQGPGDEMSLIAGLRSTVLLPR
jgi:hypothetical protein